MIIEFLSNAAVTENRKISDLLMKTRRINNGNLTFYGKNIGCMRDSLKGCLQSGQIVDMQFTVKYLPDISLIRIKYKTNSYSLRLSRVSDICMVSHHW